MLYVTNNQLVNIIWEKFPFITGTTTKMLGSHRNRNSSEMNSSEYFPEYFKEDLKMERNTKSTDGKIEYDKPILLFLDFMQM